MEESKRVLESIPLNLMSKIFSFLEFHEILLMRRTNKNFIKIVTHVVFDFLHNDSQKKPSSETELEKSDLDNYKKNLALKEGITTLSPKYLQELKALGSPPEKVKRFCSYLCLALGENYTSWKGIQKMLANPRKFLERLRDLKKLPNYKKIKEELLSEELTPAHLKKCSLAAGRLGEWLLAFCEIEEFRAKHPDFGGPGSSTTTSAVNIRMQKVYDRILGKYKDEVVIELPREEEKKQTPSEEPKQDK
jgi:hypothetical protein